jgi:Histidine kinase
MQSKKSYIRNIDTMVVLFIFLLLFLLPVIFTRENGRLIWTNVFKIWQDKILLIPLFAVNHWLLVPKLVLKKKYTSYLISVLILVSMATAGYYLYDEPAETGKQENPPPKKEAQFDRTAINLQVQLPGRPQAIPPYAELLLFSLLILAVDTGLSFNKYWHVSEEDKVRLEKENIQAQLGILRNQISPHFFMNTLNNIYALINADRERSQQAVMKLSKLMRYLLYENKNGYVLLSKEFKFTKNYIDLMKLRFTDEVEIRLILPESYDDTEIPVLLFISYLENAFKYGTSYERKSKIEALFEISNGYLTFSCANTRNLLIVDNSQGGIGLENSRQRLNLLYGDRYELSVNENEEIFSVKLKIPLI